MRNRDNQDFSNREVRRDTYQDAQGNTHTNVTRSTDTIHTRPATPGETAYRDGYVSGQLEERQVHNEVQRTRDNDNAARGLLLGVILTSILGLIVGTLFFLNQRREEPAVAPVIVPNSSAPARQPSPATSPAPRSQTTIIERERAVPVPVPSPVAEPNAPAPTVNVAPPPAPNVNVTVPPSNTAPQTAPAPTSGGTTDTAPAAGNSATTEDTTGTLDNTTDGTTDTTGATDDTPRDGAGTTSTTNPAGTGAGTNR